MYFDIIFKDGLLHPFKLNQHIVLSMCAKFHAFNSDVEQFIDYLDPIHFIIYDFYTCTVSSE